jgi:hypothetical protein
MVPPPTPTIPSAVYKEKAEQSEKAHLELGKARAHLEQGDIDGELGDTSDDDRVRGEEVCDLMSQNDENSTESSTTVSPNRNFLSDNRSTHTC